MVSAADDADDDDEGEEDEDEIADSLTDTGGDMSERIQCNEIEPNAARP